MKLDGDRILIAGESGGGNLAIATTMKLIRDGHGEALHGLYALCPYIAGRWPQAELPSSSENDGIFITVGNNRGAMAYGMRRLRPGTPCLAEFFDGSRRVRFPPDHDYCE